MINGKFWLDCNVTNIVVIEHGGKSCLESANNTNDIAKVINRTAKIDRKLSLPNRFEIG